MLTLWQRLVPHCRYNNLLSVRSRYRSRLGNNREYTLLRVTVYYSAHHFSKSFYCPPLFMHFMSSAKITMCTSHKIHSYRDLWAWKRREISSNLQINMIIWTSRNLPSTRQHSVPLSSYSLAKCPLCQRRASPPISSTAIRINRAGKSSLWLRFTPAGVQ